MDETRPEAALVQTQRTPHARCRFARESSWRPCYVNFQVVALSMDAQLAVACQYWPASCSILVQRNVQLCLIKHHVQNLIQHFLFSLPISLRCNMFFWQSRIQLAMKVRALITCDGLAPSTSLADCLTDALAWPKAALNIASGVHFFQAPCPFGLGLASSAGCKGNKWSMVLWRPEALEAIACNLKACLLWSLSFFRKKFCLPLLAFIRLALARKMARAPRPMPLPRPRPPRPRRPTRAPGRRPGWSTWPSCSCCWSPSAIPAKSCRLSIRQAMQIKTTFSRKPTGKLRTRSSLNPKWQCDSVCYLLKTMQSILG